MPLLARIILAILLGVIFGNFFNEAAVRAFLTFNGIFSQFLGFMIPLIIIGLVTPAIADLLGIKFSPNHEGVGKPIKF